VAFDFPASPTPGQVYQGYSWDSEKWIGGSVPVIKDQEFFPLDGMSQRDIPVPSWARGVHIDGAIFAPAGMPAVRISVDGTTFLAGASDYNNVGPVHSSGSTGYGSASLAPSHGLFLGLTASGDGYPILIDADLTLTRPTTSTYFHFKQYTKAYDSPAASQYRTYWGEGYVSNVSVPGALAIKALRIYHYQGGTFGAGSWVKLKWFGDLNGTPEVVQTPDVPNDGAEYMRVNGVWRKKSQTLSLAGVNSVDVTVPLGAKLGKFSGNIFQSSATGTGFVWRGSLDGTNFFAGAGDYYYVGFAHYTGSSGFVNLPGASQPYGYLTFGSDYPSIPHVFQMTLPLTRPTGFNFIGMVHSTNYNSPAANAYQDFIFKSMLLSTNLGALTAMQKIRFMFTAAVNGVADSVIDCEWVY
jgi:hypothetical protein